MALGGALEEVAKATGSTAHLYKNFEIGPQPGQCRLETQSFDEMFEPIIRHTGSVRIQPASRQSAQQP